jgi:hypothetical protein
VETNTGGTFLVIVMVFVCGGGAFDVFDFFRAPTSGKWKRPNIAKTWKR